MGHRTVQLLDADETKNGGSDAVPALVAGLQVTTRPARLHSITVFNTGPTQYIQVFDSATTPAETSVPKIQVKVLADDDRSIDFVRARIFKFGIFVCNSTTSATKTLGAANCLIDATYRQDQIRAANLPTQVWP